MITDSLLVIKPFRKSRRCNDIPAQLPPLPCAVESGSIQTSLSNLGVWADHLRFVDPRRFGAGEGNPHLAELVRWRMDILNQKYAATIPTLGLEFVAGVAAFTTYGRNTRLKMMRSLLSRSFSSCK